jgi:hypothetical protein
MSAQLSGNALALGPPANGPPAFRSMTSAIGTRCRERSACRAAGLGLVLGLVVVATAGTWAQTVSDEYRLKAAFIFRFPQFVEWPASALEKRPTVDLCVLEPSPFGGVLSELVVGESLDGRALAVRRVGAAEGASCHLLYLPTAVRDRKAVLERIRQSPILTVSDAPDFLAEGGMVQLRVINNRVRFEISLRSAELAGLRISPQLLRLALRVQGAQP